MYSYASKGSLLSPAPKAVETEGEGINYTPSPNKHFRAVSSKNIGNFDQLRQSSPNLSSSRTRSKSISDISIGNISDIDSIGGSIGKISGLSGGASTRRKSIASPARSAPSPIKLFQTTPDVRSVSSSKSGVSDTPPVASLMLSQNQLRTARQSQRRDSVKSFLNTCTEDLIGQQSIPSKKTSSELVPELTYQKPDNHDQHNVGVTKNNTDEFNDTSEPMELSTDPETSSQDHNPTFSTMTETASVAAASSTTGTGTTLLLPAAETGKEDNVLRRHRRILQMLQEFRCTVEQDDQEATRREQALKQKVAAAVVPVYSPLERENVAAKALSTAEHEVVKMMRSWNAVQTSAVAHLDDCDNKLAAERTRYIAVQRQLESSEQDLVAEGDVHRDALDQLREVVLSVAQKHGTATLRHVLASYPASWFEGLEESLNSNMYSLSRGNVSSGNSVHTSTGTGAGTGSGDHTRTEISDLDTLNKGEYLSRAMPTGDSFQRPWTFSIDKTVVEGLQTAAKAGHRFYGPPSLQHRTSENIDDLAGTDANSTANKSRPGSASNSRASSRSRARSGTLTSFGTTSHSAYLQHNAEPPNPSSDVSTDGLSRGLHSSGNSIASSSRDGRSVSTSRLGSKTLPSRVPYSQSASFAPANEAKQAAEQAEFRHAELRNQALISRAITKLEAYRNEVRAEGTAAGGRSTSPSVLKNLSQQQAMIDRLSAHTLRTSAPVEEAYYTSNNVSNRAVPQQSSGALQRASSAGAASLRSKIAPPAASNSANSAKQAISQQQPPPQSNDVSTVPAPASTTTKVTRTMTRSPTVSAVSPRYQTLYSANLFSPTTGAPIDFRSVTDGNRISRAYSGAADSSDAGYSGTRYSDYMLEDMVVDEKSGALRFNRTPVSSKKKPVRESYSYIKSPSHSPVPNQSASDRDSARLSPVPVSVQVQDLHSPAARPLSPQLRPGSPVITGNQWNPRSADKSHISSSSSENDAQSVHSNSVQASAGAHTSAAVVNARHGGISSVPTKDVVLRVAVPVSTLPLSQQQAGARGPSSPGSRSKTPPPWTSTRSISAPVLTSTHTGSSGGIGFVSPKVATLKTARFAQPLASSAPVNNNQQSSQEWKERPTPADAWESQQGPPSPGESATSHNSASVGRKLRNQSVVPKVRVPAAPSPSPVLASSVLSATVGAAGRTTVLPNQAQLTAQEEAARYIESMRRTLR